MESTPSPPHLLSIPRFTTLIVSLVVALCAGTNYVYSGENDLTASLSLVHAIEGAYWLSTDAYAPQLGARLRMTYTQLNVVALAGNMGVYSTGPILGKIIDSQGPRTVLLFAFVALLSGYLGIRQMYNAGLPDDALLLSSFGLCIIVACNFLTGAGGNGALSSAVNSTAKTFPDKARASTTGLVISGFGLSAFLFSTIAHIFYAGNTSAFLLLLALGTSLPMVLGIFFVRPIPYGTAENIVVDDGSRTHLLDCGDAVGLSPYTDAESVRSGYLQDDDVLASRPTSGLEARQYRSNLVIRGRGMGEDGSNIHGLQLWRSGDFWLLFSNLSMLSGTGLTYINNVGSMSLALFNKDRATYDPVEAARWQATQVSSISILNFAGRICIGVLSDYGKNKLALPRSYSITLVACLFLISQVTAANIDDVANLWISSALLGFAHGSMYALFPMVCLDWFGISHFSENWGYLSMAPLIAGNMFSLIFGLNMDAHQPRPKSTLLTLGEPARRQCTEGRQCYVETLYVTIAATALSVLLSLWAGFQDRSRLERESARDGPLPDGLWREGGQI